MKRLKPILIVDDDADDRYLIIRAFRDTVLADKLQFAVNGADALKYLDALPRDAELPGLIVLDLNMPILDGISTLNLLKSSSRYKDIPVVIFTTSANPTEKKRCMDLGAADFIVKPNTYSGLKLSAQLLHNFVGDKTE